MRPRKLTEAQKAEIRAIVTARRALPTNKQLAEKYGVCKQLIDQVTAVPGEINGVDVIPSYSPPETEAAQ